MRSKHFDSHGIASCSCDWVQARLWDYLDGELNTAARAKLQAHLDSCPTCERELQAARRSEKALHSALSTAPAAGDLRAGFYAKLAASTSQPHWSRRFGWTLAVPALAAGVLAVVFWRPSAVPNREALNLPVSNLTAIVPPVTKPAKEKTNFYRFGAKKPAAVVAKNTSPVSGSVRLERLKPVERVLTVRLTLQEIRQMRTKTTAQAELPEVRLLNRFGETKLMADAQDRRVALSASSERLRENVLVRRGSDADTDGGALAWRAGTIEREVASRTFGFDQKTVATLSLNVQKVAMTAALEPDGEAYLEVADDTRNFSSNTRVASSQDSDGSEVELSISSDEPDSPAEGAGAE